MNEAQLNAFSPRLKLRLQDGIFSGGLETDGQRLWNTEKVSAFSPLRELKALCCLLVTPRRIELLSAT